MKQALQAILIAPDPKARLDIMLSKLKFTIREGHRDYKTGPVVICCHIVPWAVMATITSVRLTTIAEVTDEELKAVGYKDHKDLLKGLQFYYPWLTMKSPVTVIGWDNLDGAYSKKENIVTYAKENGIEKLLGNFSKEE